MERASCTRAVSLHAATLDQRSHRWRRLDALEDVNLGIVQFTPVSNDDLPAHPLSGGYRRATSPLRSRLATR
jgi:hypothetical protein